jgi:hypothetical protein
MILHFSHIGLTDGRTFTLASLSKSKIFGSCLSRLWRLELLAATALRSVTQHEEILTSCERNSRY